MRQYDCKRELVTYRLEYQCEDDTVRLDPRPSRIAYHRQPLSLGPMKHPGWSNGVISITLKTSSAVSDAGSRKEFRSGMHDPAFGRSSG
jgi:hypothetical protein